MIEKIKTEFKISKSGTRAFCYVGLDIEQNGSNLYVTQQHYHDWEKLHITGSLLPSFLPSLEILDYSFKMKILILYFVSYISP